MKKNNAEPDSHSVPYKKLPLVKPEKGVVPFNNNIVLKISKEVNLLNTLLKHAILKQERLFFLILSDEPLIDIEALKQYLMEKDLTKFAENEILKISEIINDTVLLSDEYDKLPESEFFTEYSFAGKDGRTSKGMVFGSLFYVIISKSKITSSNEDLFRKEYDNLPFFYMLERHKILNSFNQLMNLIKLLPETSVNHQTDKEENGKLELHNHIFQGNAFKVWQSMFDSFKITEKNPADVKFIFEVMRYDKLIRAHVRQIDFLNWINDTYQLTIGRARYSDFKNDVKRMAIYKQSKAIHIK